MTDIPVMIPKFKPKPNNHIVAQAVRRAIQEAQWEAQRKAEKK
jgi:hypothetical protein